MPSPGIPRPLTGRGILFDMDGVLVDSLRCIEGIWRRWAAGRGLDAEAILAIAHGRFIRDTLALAAPHLDRAREVAILDRMEEDATDGVVPIEGVSELLASIPADRWGVVTSGSPVIVARRLGACGIPAPPILVSSIDVRRGKPDPEGYLLGARRLGIDPADAVVVEDAPAGIAAAKAAGMTAIAVLTTTARERLAEADAVVATAGDLRVHLSRGRLEITSLS